MRTTSFTGIQSGLLPGNVPGDREIAESLEGNKSWDSWTKSTACILVCFPVVIEVGSLGWNDTAAKIQNKKNNFYWQFSSSLKLDFITFKMYLKIMS